MDVKQIRFQTCYSEVSKVEKYLPQIDQFENFI
jgi:hypothetical protein